MAATNNDHEPFASSLDALLAAQIGEHSNHSVNRPSAKISLGEALHRIQSGHYAPQLRPVLTALETHGHLSKEYSAAKDRLPVLTFSGICHRQKGASHIEYPSGAISLDFDKLPTTEVAKAYRDATYKIPNTVAAFLTPSRRGFKTVVALKDTPPPRDGDAYRAAFTEARLVYEDALGISVDPSGQDPTRFCYVCHDPDMVWGQGTPLSWRISDANVGSETTEESAQRDTGTKAGPRVREIDNATVEDALRHIPCPRRTGDGKAYDQWLDLVTLQKAVGRAPEQIAGWCEGGKAKSCGDVGEILTRWDGLNDDDPGLALARIKNCARRQGWNDPWTSGFSGTRNNGHRRSGRNRQGPRSWFNASPPRQDPPDIVLPALKPQRPYPVPPVMGWHHAGIHQISGGTSAAVGTGMLASMSLLASGDFDVAWPPQGSTATPIGLFFLHLAGSGGRKSAVWRICFAGHKEADIRIMARWEIAKEEWNEWAGQNQKNKRKTGGERPGLPTKYSPRALRKDATPEALAQRFSGGRKTQGLVSSEAGSVISPATWSMSRERRVKTMSDYNDLYSEGQLDLDRVRDDLEISVDGVRLTIAWAAQPDIGLTFISSDDASNGFAARTLISMDDHLPDYLGTEYLWAQGESARGSIADWTRLIIQVRERQDSEYAEENSGRRRVITMTAEAEDAIVDIGGAAHEAAQEDRSLSPHEVGFLVRVGEHIARVAAILAAYRCYTSQERGVPVVSLEDVEASHHIVQWHYEEMLRQAGRARATEDAKATQWAAENLYRCVVDGRYQSTVPDAYRVNHWLGSAAAGPAKNLRSDPDARARVLELLETHGYIELIARGAYKVNLRVEGMNEATTEGQQEGQSKR